MRLAADGHSDELPFYVRPPRGRPRADVLFIASTFTYQAYANHARGNTDAAFRARIAAWDAYPHSPDDHPEYGRSTYNRHRDGSGICYSSRLRPALTLRPRYLTFLDERGSGLRHYPADTHLLDWLEVQGIPFDVVTDEDVDAEGAALLAPYATVLTGSHPEYHTARTLDAHADYLDGGGGWSTWAAMASTGASPPVRRCPGSSRCGAPRAASGPGTPRSASITTPLTAPTAACGDATGAHRSSSSASASRRKGCSRGRSIAASPAPTTRGRPGSSRVSTTR
jgi:hypothetical protein